MNNIPRNYRNKRKAWDILFVHYAYLSFYLKLKYFICTK